MTVLVFTALIALGSIVAGFLGSLTGLGGGVVLVPLLVLVLHVDMRYAIGAALISVIATSSGSAAAYLREGYSNIRIAMLLEVATTLGAIAGAMIATHVSTSAIAVVFGATLLYSAWQARRPHSDGPTTGDGIALAQRLRLEGDYPTSQGLQHYVARRIPLGASIMFGAGCLSGLLGIGSGALKVLAMDRAMRLPFKVSTTTSNFMIGVTAAASAGLYLSRGYIDPGLALPVMLGVLAGSMIGARVLMVARPDRLRLVFSVVIVLLGFEMIYNGFTGRI